MIEGRVVSGPDVLHVFLALIDCHASPRARQEFTIEITEGGHTVSRPVDVHIVGLKHVAQEQFVLILEGDVPEGEWVREGASPCNSYRMTYNAKTGYGAVMFFSSGAPSSSVQPG